MRTHWVRFGSLAISLLAPRRCAACDVLLTGSRPGGFCRRCEPALADPLVEHSASLTCVALGPYADPLESAVRRLKFEGRTDLARPLGAALGAALRDVSGGVPHTLVPVPLHPKRLAGRGYNQSALLARAAGAVLSWPVSYFALERVRATAQQAALAPLERAENTHGAFRARGVPPAGPLVLVDDVFTTLSTAKDCARALREGGGTVTALVAVARGGSFVMGRAPVPQALEKRTVLDVAPTRRS